MPDDWDRLRSALSAAGVPGATDVGRFVNDTTHFAPSRLDERAAMPVLMEALRWLTEPRAVAAAAAHLRRPWARPHAFPALKEAFVRWAPGGGDPGWTIGDALAASATKEQAPDPVAIAEDGTYGNARAMVVASLWRFKSVIRADAVLSPLVEDPDVALAAMQALRRVLGAHAIQPLLEGALRSEHELVRNAAHRELRKAQRAGSR